METKANEVHPIKAVAISPQRSSQEVITPVTPRRATVGETTHQAEAQDRLVPEMRDQVQDRRSQATGSSGTGILIRNTTSASTRSNKGGVEVPDSPF